MHDGKEVASLVNIWINPNSFLRIDLDDVASKPTEQDQLDACVARRGTQDEDNKPSAININNADDIVEAFFDINVNKTDKAFQASIARKIAGPDGPEFLDQL